jgi:tRNA-specific 2-thiouridylase
MSSNLKKVCVAMSGGVDSAVAASMLVEQGYEVFGAFMKNWSLDQQGVDYKPWEDEANDAKLVCEKLNIPFYVFDFEKEYQERVVNSFVDEYRQGRTPNPDVLCNREIKFDLFLKKAEKLGADLIATGHYAQIVHRAGKYHLLAGVDLNKDQTYFLYTLTSKDLEKIMFPIGHLLKPEVRNLALKYDLPNAQKKDSQGVCFIGPVSMRKFLETYIKPQKGPVILANGTIIAEHDGVFFYTEGQRHGFNVRGGHAPLYIAEKRLTSNELVVATKDDPTLYSSDIEINALTWVNNEPDMPKRVMCRIRYRQQLYPATIVKNNGAFQLQFEKPIFAVSPGQAAVFYEGSEVIGGGTIVKRLD